MLKRQKNGVELIKNLCDVSPKFVMLGLFRQQSVLLHCLKLLKVTILFMISSPPMSPKNI